MYVYKSIDSTYKLANQLFLDLAIFFASVYSLSLEITAVVCTACAAIKARSASEKYEALESILTFVLIIVVPANRRGAISRP